LLELLVVIGIVAILSSILVPVLGKARQKTKVLLGSRRQHEVVSSVSLYSIDNDDLFPQSVATVGTGNGWNWSDPRKLIASDEIHLGMHRSMGGYLGSYIEDADTMFCPSAPRKYPYLQAAWEAGDDWDNPDTLFPRDPLTGTYCFYWNYTGLLYEKYRLFEGPWSSSGSPGQSKVLMSDYAGYDHWRKPNAFGSCEKIPASATTKPNLPLMSDWWYRRSTGSGPPDVKLNAGYVDGHVGSFGMAGAVKMKVIIDRSNCEPYLGGGIGPGEFFLPPDACR